MARTVSNDDRAKMHRIGVDLEAGETDDRGTPDQRDAIVAMLNDRRTSRGAPPLDDRAPEEGFHDRARSLGMARIDR